MNAPNVVRIRSADDPRLAPFLHLRDKPLRQRHELFLAESTLVVERLLDSPLKPDALLCAQCKAEHWQQRWPHTHPMYVVDDDTLHATLGFKLHQGVIATAHRPPSNIVDFANTQTLVVCPEITDVENLGLLVRVAAGLGADAMLLGPRCADPWYRRAVRLSMGAVFQLPIARRPDLLDELRLLQKQHGYDVVGTALHPDAIDLRDTRRNGPTAVVLGSEGYGLTTPQRDACSRLVTIPMQHGVDSLNVAVAAGIVLHHFAPST